MLTIGIIGCGRLVRLNCLSQRIRIWALTVNLNRAAGERDQLFDINGTIHLFIVTKRIPRNDYPQMTGFVALRIIKM